MQSRASELPLTLTPGSPWTPGDPGSPGSPCKEIGVKNLHPPKKNPDIPPHSLLTPQNWQKSNPHPSRPPMYPFPVPSLQGDPGSQHLQGDLVDPGRGIEIGIIAYGRGGMGGQSLEEGLRSEQ